MVDSGVWRGHSHVRSGVLVSGRAQRLNASTPHKTSSPPAQVTPWLGTTVDLVSSSVVCDIVASQLTTGAPGRISWHCATLSSRPHCPSPLPPAQPHTLLIGIVGLFAREPNLVARCKARGGILPK